MIGARGIEGGAVYALSAALRDAIEAQGSTILIVDLKPDLRTRRWRSVCGGGPANRCRPFCARPPALAPIAIALLREAGAIPEDADALAARIKALPLRLLAPAPIERAISSAGGVEWREIDDAFMLRKMPGVFVAGEMIDWEAPTGGYLLQASFATGAAAGRGAAAWIERHG